MSASSPSAPLGWSVATTLLAGVAAVQTLGRLPPTWLCVLLAIAMAWAWSRNGRWRPLAAFGFGFAWASLFAASYVACVSEVGSRPEVIVEGRVVDLPRRGESSVHFDFDIDSDSIGHLAGHRVRLAWYGRPPSLPPGSRWRLSLRLKRPETRSNPGGFDAARQALAEGVIATGYVRADIRPRMLAAGQGIDFWRQDLSTDIAYALPDRRDRFIQALAIGDTRGLDGADWEILRASGLTHQIAISGFHVGMVAGLGALVVTFLFRILPRLGRLMPRPQASALGGLVAATGYAALAGFSLPTIRTLLMIAVVVMARLLRRRLAVSDAVPLALIAILLVDPVAVLAAGFWLSFAGVAWLIWCLPNETPSHWLTPFLKAQGVAALGLLPFTIWFFGQASLLGPFANLIGVPVISLGVVPLALLGMMANAVSTSAGTWAWQGAAWLMDLLWQALTWASQWPSALVWLPEPSPLTMLLAAVAVFWLLLPRGVPGKPLSACLLLPMIWPALAIPASEEVAISVMDVGAGQSVLLQTRHHSLLFDTGPGGARGVDAGQSIIVPALHAVGIGQLDAIVVSQGGAGHSGGLHSIRRAYPRSQLVAPAGWAPPGATWCQAGTHWVWDGVEFEFLHPPEFFPYLKQESSCVLRVEASGTVALLPGDVSAVVESTLLRLQGPRLRTDWLLVPRHGSGASSSAAFVAATRPDWAVISGADSSRQRAPDSAVMARYRRSGAHISETALTGWTRFRLGANGVSLMESRRQSHDRYWLAPP